MLTSHRRALGRFTVAAILGGMGVSMVAGCGDAISHTIPTKQEGLAHYQRGEYTDAAGAFQSVVRSEPRDYESRYYLAESNARMGNYQRAIQAYRATLDAMDLTYEGKRDHAFRAKVLDSFAKTIAQSDQRHVELENLEAEASAKASAELYLILAKSYRYAGDHDTALTRYNQATSLASNNAAYQKEHGLYLEQIGMVEQALPHLRRANALDPEDIEVADALRRHGIVPGPSLKERDELAKPLMPTGPLPDVDLTNLRIGGNRSADSEQPQTTDNAIPPATVQSPRD